MLMMSEALLAQSAIDRLSQRASVDADGEVR